VLSVHLSGGDVVLNERSVPLLIDGIPGDATRSLALAGQAEKGESAIGGVGERIPDALPTAIIGRARAFWIVDTAQGVFPPVRNALILRRLRHPEHERFRHRGADPAMRVVIHFEGIVSLTVTSAKRSCRVGR
jgi:hypothetical protein